MTTPKPTQAGDLKLLEDVLAVSTLEPEQREAFEDMRNNLGDGAHYRLTEKQRAWAKKLLDIPEYENLWSSGKVPRGAEVPLPPSLQNLPKKPPGRR